MIHFSFTSSIFPSTVLCFSCGKKCPPALWLARARSVHFTLAGRSAGGQYESGKARDRLPETGMNSLVYFCYSEFVKHRQEG